MNRYLRVLIIAVIAVMGLVVLTVLVARFLPPAWQEWANWLVRIVVAMLAVLAALSQFTGYSLRDLIERQPEERLSSSACAAVDSTPPQGIERHEKPGPIEQATEPRRVSEEMVESVQPPLETQSDFERGLRRLRDLLSDRAPNLLPEFHTLEAQLLANLREQQLYGYSKTILAEHERLVGQMDHLVSQAALPFGFSDLCRERPASTRIQKQGQRSILVIGQLLGIDGIKSIEWVSDEPNVADYDIAIMDLTTTDKVQLPPRAAYSVQSRFQVDMSRYLQWQGVRRGIEKLLLSGGALFVIGKPEIVVHPECPSRVLDEARFASLLPFVFFGEAISGRSIASVDPRFEFYFREVDSWKYVLTGQVAETFRQQMEYRVDALVKNRANEMLALSVSVWRDRSIVPGAMYLLPPPTKVPSYQAITLLLAHVDDLMDRAEAQEVRKPSSPAG